MKRQSTFDEQKLKRMCSALYVILNWFFGGRRDENDLMLSPVSSTNVKLLRPTKHYVNFI